MISFVFEGVERATKYLAHVDPNFAEYAVASLLFEQTWVAQK